MNIIDRLKAEVGYRERVLAQLERGGLPQDAK